MSHPQHADARGRQHERGRGHEAAVREGQQAETCRQCRERNDDEARALLKAFNFPFRQ